MEKIIYLQPVKFAQKTWLVQDWEDVTEDEIIGWRDGVWEHNQLHDFDDPDEYYANMVPVDDVKKVFGHYFFQNGFHRANFCLKYNKLLPVKIRD